MASSVPSANGFTVVTHVYPQQGAQNFTSPQNGTVLAPSSPLRKYLKGEPAVLGTVQIMIGVVILLFGIVTAFYASISTYSGIMFWGAGIYITAGSLTVRASKVLSVCLVKASLGMNIFSTITAGTAIILHSFDVAFQYYYFYCDGRDSCYMAVEMYRSRQIGIAAVMILLSILEFIVSICVSAFACKATCACSSEQVVYQVPPSIPTSHLFAPSVNISEMPHLQSSVIPPVQQSCANGFRADRPEDLPPVYTVTQG